MKYKTSNCIKLLNSFSEKEMRQLKELAACRFLILINTLVPLIDVLKSRIWRKRAFDGTMRSHVYKQVFEDVVLDNQLSIKQRNLLFQKYLY